MKKVHYRFAPRKVAVNLCDETGFKVEIYDMLGMPDITCEECLKAITFKPKKEIDIDDKFHPNEEF